MSTRRRPYILVLLLGLVAGSGRASDIEPSGLELQARAFVALLAKGDYTTASKNFDDAMKKAFPVDKLETTWKGLVDKAGAFKKQTGTHQSHVHKFDVVAVTCEFEKCTLDMNVVFDVKEHITGLFFRPSKPVEYQPPAYVNPASFHETEGMIGSGDWAVPGTLTTPVGDGPFPAVVLVAGSGPNDRDETVGPNKPFRDLAWGLASRGVAVLRYDKRTLTHADRFASPKEPMTIKEEVLDDAVAAVRLLHDNKAINPKKIFLAGHSLGGMLLPRIAQDVPDLAGVIILAGVVRPLEDVIVEQMSYIFSLEDKPTDDMKAEMEKLKTQATRVKDPKLTADAPDILFRAPAGYWLSLRDYKPGEAAAKLKVPMLILQGERDYNATMEDFGLWKKALAGRKDVEFKSYPKLNHLFFEGEGKAKPAEYEKVGHVSGEVVEDIAAWVKKH